jgi:DNA-binding NtrC family response regulator
MSRVTRDDIRVLHVDDDPAYLDLVSDFLDLEFDHFRVATATDPDEGMAILESDSIDCVVSDYDMPGTNGLEFLDAVSARYPSLPFVLFTGKGSEEIAGEAISRGVSDYLQ